MERQKKCCDVFMKMANNFNWFALGKGEDKVLVMPSIRIDDIDYRINHCPSCGKEVRNIELNPAEL